ncbi:MAG: hypothetical protein JXA66_08975 [Oligoflexia bacterium]|nr:hypothetical protein [Oligoflexia bacterium]
MKIIKNLILLSIILSHSAIFAWWTRDSIGSKTDPTWSSRNVGRPDKELMVRIGGGNTGDDEDRSYDDDDDDSDNNNDTKKAETKVRERILRTITREYLRNGMNENVAELSSALQFLNENSDGTDRELTILQMFAGLNKNEMLIQYGEAFIEKMENYEDEKVQEANISQIRANQHKNVGNNRQAAFFSNKAGEEKKEAEYRKEMNKDKKARIYQYISDAYYRMGNLEKASAYSNLSRETSLFTQADAHYRAGDLEKAAAYYNMGQAISENHEQDEQ